MSILPAAWDLPESIRKRVGQTAGRQRLIAEEGHVLVLLHEVPSADATAERAARLFWRAPSGAYRSTGGDDRTIKPLRQHVERYLEAIDAIEDRLDRASSAADWFGILTDVAPLVRSTRNLARVLQELRDHVGADRDVIGVRDRAADAERAADLVHQWASQGLDYCTARSNEEQARLATYLGRASQRLNLVAALTFPVTALGSFFGVNLASGLEQAAAPHLFWALGAAALAIGVGLAWRMPRIPAELVEAPRGVPKADGRPGR